MAQYSSVAIWNCKCDDWYVAMHLELTAATLRVLLTSSCQRSLHPKMHDQIAMAAFNERQNAMGVQCVDAIYADRDAHACNRNAPPMLRANHIFPVTRKSRHNFFFCACRTPALTVW